MNNYIWAAIVVVLFLFSLWRMKQEYRRGFRDGATKILNEWKQFHESGEDY
jgi:hypothetical protein